MAGAGSGNPGALTGDEDRGYRTGKAGGSDRLSRTGLASLPDTTPATGRPRKAALSSAFPSGSTMHIPDKCDAFGHNPDSQGRSNGGKLRFHSENSLPLVFTQDWIIPVPHTCHSAIVLKHLLSVSICIRSQENNENQNTFPALTESGREQEDGHTVCHEARRSMVVARSPTRVGTCPAHTSPALPGCPCKPERLCCREKSHFTDQKTETWRSSVIRGKWCEAQSRAAVGPAVCHRRGARASFEMNWDKPRPRHGWGWWQGQYLGDGR